MEPPSLFPLLSDDDLHDFCAQLLCEDSPFDRRSPSHYQFNGGSGTRDPALHEPVPSCPCASSVKRDWLSCLSSSPGSLMGSVKSASQAQRHSSQPPPPRSGQYTQGAVLRLSDVHAALLRETAFGSRGSAKIQRNVDERPHGPSAPTQQPESKLEKKSVSTGVNGIILHDTSETHKGDKLARRRELHIYGDRKRRRGMKDLYGNLRSLVPGANVSEKKLLLVNKTMDYIISLSKQLDELEKQKVKSMRAMKEKKKRDSSKQNSEANGMEQLHISTNYKISKASFRKKRKTKLEISNHSENPRMKNSICENQKGKDGACDNDVVDWISMNEGKFYKDCTNENREVHIHFCGDDALINVLTSKKIGVWSSLLEALQQLGFYILNVTLSTGPNFYHHRIHAKVSSSSKLQSIDIQQRIMAFIC